MHSKNIIIIGLAGSAGVARIFNDCLLGLGIYSTYLSDRVEIERVVSQLDKNGLIFGISHSGETQEVVYALKKGRENRVYTIGMTNFVSSSVARFSDVVLLTTVPENLLGSYSCQPRIAQLALLEFITFEISTRFNKGGGSREA
jgi:DNA-binding MurR/RpiR family transcriptional regulator